MPRLRKTCKEAYQETANNIDGQRPVRKPRVLLKEGMDRLAADVAEYRTYKAAGSYKKDVNHVYHSLNMKKVAPIIIENPTR